MIQVFDTETAKSRPGCEAPVLACVSTSDGYLLGRGEAEAWADWALGGILRGFAIAYDLVVLAANFPRLLPRIFQAYEEDRVSCGRVRQQLLDIAEGCFRGWYRRGGQAIKVEYSLQALVTRRFGVHVDKGEDTWRLRYGELVDIPTHEWPVEARTYALEDAVWHARVWDAQEPGRAFLEDEHRQARHAFWRQLMRTWGIHTDARAVDRFEHATRAEKNEIARALVEAGLRRPDRVLKQGKNKGAIREGSRDMRACEARVVAAYAALGKPYPLTDGGAPSTAKETLEDSGDPVLESLAHYKHLEHVLSNEIPLLRLGTEYPIHSWYDMIESGRVGSSDPNLTNFPRKGPMRECFLRRPGRLFLVADYAGLELHCWAQVCLKALGFSGMAVVLNAGGDPHLAMACQGLGISYEEGKRRKDGGDKEVKVQRGSAKVGNFGFQGGMGIDTFISSARKNYGVYLTREVTERLKATWIATWPEARPYLRWIGDLTRNGPVQVEQLFSRRFRTVDRYAECANGFFQALGADAAQAAGWLIARACYVDTSSPLFGCRIVLFVHDEFVLEIPDDRWMHERAEELIRLMKLGAAPWLPDVPARVEAALMYRYSKEHEPARDEHGRLVPSDRREAA